MQETLIQFKTAKLAKEREFNELCLCAYKKSTKELYCHVVHGRNKLQQSRCNSQMILAKDPRYSAPTQSLLQKWIREIHKIEVFVLPYTKSEGLYEVVVDKAVTTWSGYESYEEALETGLYEALKLIKVSNVK